MTTLGYTIALLITLLVFADVISTIGWLRNQRDPEKLRIMLATLAITIALLMSEYILQAIQK